MLGIFLFSFGAAFGQLAAPKDPKALAALRRSYQSRINPATEVPQFPQYFKWVITGDVNGKKVYDQVVPVYRIAKDEGRLVKISEIAIGSEIKLLVSQSFYQRHFYQVSLPQKGQNGKPIKGWVDGLAIARDEQASFKPAKSKKP